MKRNELSEMLKVTKPNLGRLVAWLEENCHQFEFLDIHQWYGRLWYVTVRDNRAEGLHLHPSDVRVGFTVDVQGDQIYWNDNTSINEPGGNCFTRSNKWKTLIRRHFNLGRDDIWAAQVHSYKDHLHPELRERLAKKNSKSAL